MLNINERSITRKEHIEVGYFFNTMRNRLRLTLFSGDTGFVRKITDQNVHRPGLALAGFVDLFTFNRVQVFGNTEMRYLSQLSESAMRSSLENIFHFEVPCIILTDGNKPFPVLIELADRSGIPIFGSEFSTTKLVYFLSDFLDDQFAPRASIHGAFVDVYGVGLLFVGHSGIGKSEVALDLVERGHRLVADDVIILTKKGEGILMGTGTDLNKHFMEIRGLGLLNVEKMFGIRAIRFQKRLEVIVELENWDDNANYDRTGLDESTSSVLGVDIPYVKLPIIPGKNITVISEVIALHYLLKTYGYDAPRDFQSKLNDVLMKNRGKIDRQVDYFQHDFE